MPTTTAVLRSAASMQKKVRAYEDEVAAYQWQLSAKTADDWEWYQSYLTSRGSQSSTPEEALSYTKKLNTAENQYVSNEIERASIQVETGNASTVDKFNTMYGLFERAVERGNYDLAQNLQLRLINLQEKIQNEAERAQRVANTLAKSNNRTIKEWIDSVIKGDQTVTLANGDTIEGLGKINMDFAANAEKTDWATEAYATVSSIYSVLEDAYASIGSQDAMDDFETKFAKYFTDGSDGTEPVKFKVGGISMTFQELDAAYRGALANNPIYTPELSTDTVTGETKYTLKKTYADDYAWVFSGVNPQTGMEDYEMVAVRTKTTSPQETLQMRVYTDKEGNRYVVSNSPNENGKHNFSAGEKELSDKDFKKLPTLQEQLESQGITIVEGSGNEISIKLGDGRVYNNVLLNADGTIRYMDQDGLVEFDAFTNTRRIVNPEDDVQIFGRASEFGGMISKMTPTGDRITDQIIGKKQLATDVLLTAKNTKLSTSEPDKMGFSYGIGGLNLQGGTTGLLQGADTVKTAEQTRKALIAEAEATRIQAAKTILQSNVGTNLNQTPVTKTNLKVARPTAAPKVTVSKPTPAPKVTGVAVAKPGKITSVGVAKPSGKVTVR